MERDNLIPLLGLLGIVAAGGLMLLATSGPEVTVPPPTVDQRTGEIQGQPAPGIPDLIWRNDDIYERQIPAEGSPNVVVVVACSVRREALGPYGGPEGLTPYLDGMAARGALFEDAIAPSVWSKESLAAMLTGRYALELGVAEPGEQPSTRTVPQDAVMLGERFAESGWWTVGVNASPELRRRTSAIWQGIDYGRDAMVTGFQLQNRLTDMHAVQQGIRMMNERPLERPFYLQMVLVDSHKPIQVPPPEFAPYAEQGLPTPAYLATIRRLDDAMGVIFDWLDESGLAETTYVVLVGDHGEGLSQPEHHGPAHGKYLAQSAASVPWLVVGPGIPAGRRVSGLASGIDLGPTLLGLAGIEQGLDAPGALDHSALLTAAEGATTRDSAITDTWYLDANRAAIWTAEYQCQKDFASDQPTGDGFLTGCFDRIVDPDFYTPIDDPELMARLVAWRAEHAPEKPTE